MKTMLSASKGLALTEVIACLKEPAPESSVFMTVKVAAWVAMQKKEKVRMVMSRGTVRLGVILFFFTKIPNSIQ